MTEDAWLLVAGLLSGAVLGFHAMWLIAVLLWMPNGVWVRRIGNSIEKYREMMPFSGMPVEKPSGQQVKPR